jgi:hypothetical protein
LLEIKKKNCANLQRIIEIFIQKVVIKLSKMWFGIRDPGSRSKKGTRSRIRICNTADKGGLFYLLHKLRLTYLFLANPALDDPQVRIPYFRQQRLLGDFITHPFPTLSKPKQNKELNIISYHCFRH